MNQVKCVNGSAHIVASFYIVGNFEKYIIYHPTGN